MNDLPRSIETILAEAVEISSRLEREAYLARVCGEDFSLRQEAERLIDCHLAAHDEFLQSPLAPTFVVQNSIPTVGTQIGPYKLREQLGEGGMGIVYLATQEHPVRRSVALKIIKPGLDTRQVISRFEAERQALAMMDHRNIARVLDAGTTEKGHPFFVMELVKGMPITAFCQREQLPRNARLSLFIDVCRAVQHAHQKGIIHRDLKPSNILITVQDGLPIVKVIDFGIAKAVGGRLTEHSLQTGFRQLIGTLLYMSPEQASISAVDVDTRSDVYSLGVVLYELLTSTTPFELKEPHLAAEAEYRRLICEQDPPAPSARITTLPMVALSTLTESGHVDPRRLRRQLRGELDWVVMKALDKNRNRRYESPSALATDLQRYLDHEPVQAGPPSTLYRLRKVARRNRGTISTAMLVLTAILVGAAASVWQAREADAARRIANRERDNARRVAQGYREVAYAGDMRLATQAWQQNDVPKMHELLARHLPQDSEKDVRGFEWYFLSSHAGVRSREILHSEKPLYVVRIAPDGRVAAVAGASAQIHLLDSVSLTVRAVIETGQTEVNGLDFSSDSSLLASAGDDGSVAIWDVLSGRQVERFRAHDTAVFQVLFANSDASLWSGGTDGRIRLWTVPGPKLEREMTSHAASIESLAKSRFGILAAGSADCHVTLWDANQPAPQWTFDDSPSDFASSKVNAVAFTPSGRILATGHDNGVLTLRRPDSGVLLAQQEYPDAVHSITFAPVSVQADTVWMAVGDRGGSIHLVPVDGWSSLSGVTGTTWRASRGRHWNAHTGRVYSIAFTSDGTQLLTAGEDGSLKAWSLDTPDNSWQVATPSESFEPSGAQSVLVCGDGITEVHLRKQETLHTVKAAGLTLRIGRYLRDSDQFLLSDGTGHLVLMDHQGQERRRITGVGNGRIRVIAGSGDGQTFAAACTDDSGSHRRIELFSPSGRTSIPCQHLVHAMELTTDGRSLIYDQEKDVLVVAVATGEVVQTLTGHRSSIWQFALSPDGEHLASCSRDRTARIWNLSTGQEVWSEVSHSRDTNAVAFSPDGNTVATSGDDGLLRLWRWRQGTLVFEYPLIDGPANQIHFSDDGRRIMIHAKEHLRIYDATVGELPVDSSQLRAGSDERASR